MNQIERRSSREKGYAKVLFEKENIPGYLRDFSPKGCRIELVESISLDQGEKRKVRIIPEEIIGIGPIIGTLEIRWLKKENIFTVIGSRLLSVKDEESKKNYKSLLVYYSRLREKTPQENKSISGGGAPPSQDSSSS